jgi:hypothetical protein
MNRLSLALLGFALATLSTVGQDLPPPRQTVSRNAIAHGSFPIKTVRTLDSSKLRQDDTVQFETAGAFKLPDGTLVPKGSVLIGRVITAKARANGESESQLKLAFNRLVLAGGKEFSVKGSLQAVYPPLKEKDPGVPNAPTVPHGEAQVMDPVYRPMETKQGADMTNDERPQLVVNLKSTGVYGVPDLQLENGALISKRRCVKIDNGARLVVQIEIFG